MNTGAAPRLEYQGCPLGCPRDEEFVLEGSDRLNRLPGRFCVVRCRTCGLLRTNPRPTPETMGDYYPDDYGPYRSTLVSEASEDQRTPARRRLSAWLSRATDSGGERLPDLPPGRLLEIGCASGAFLRRMSLRGWTVEGIEFSASAAAAARSLGHSVFAGPLETAPAPSEPFDLVVGWMVLEHLHQPVAALKRLLAWTRPGGWLVVSMPDAGSWEFRAFRDSWYPLHLPNHLTHFSVPTLARTLKETGWTLERVLHHRDVRSLVGSLGLALEERGHPGKLTTWLRRYPEGGGRAAYLLYPVAAMLAAMGPTGAMTVWARRGA